MNIAMNTLLFTAELTNEHFNLFKRFKEYGFNGVEIAFDSKEQCDFAAALSMLKDNGLVCSAVCGLLGENRDIRGPNREYVKTGIQYARDCIDICAVLECGLVAGPFYSAVGRANMESEKARREQWLTAVSNFKEICKYAEDKGIYFAIEPLNRFETDFINTCAQAREMIADVDSPMLKIHLDTFHMNIEEKSTIQAILDADDALYLLHASENDRGAPGTGQVPWEGIKDALDKIDYDKWVTIESFTPDNKIIAKAASIWRQTEKDGFALAEKGAKYLKELFS